MQRKRSGRLTAFACLASIALASCFGGDPDPGEPPSSSSPDRFGSVTIAPGEPIELGLLLESEDGAGSSTGRDAARGAQFALDFLDGTLDGRAGEFLGHPVTFVEERERCGRGGSLADQGANDPFEGRGDSIVGVIGPGCAAAVLEGPGVALAERGVVMISPTATDARLTVPGVRSPFFFRTAYNDELEGLAVARFALDEAAAERAGVAYDEESATGASSSFRAAFEAEGGVVTASGSLGDPTTPASQVLGALGQVDPDMVYVDAGFPVCAQAMRQAGSVPDLRAVPVVASGECLHPASVDAAEGSFSYLAGPDNTQLIDDDFYRMQLVPAYEEQFGTAPTGMFHAQAFDATLMLLDAVERVAARSEGGTLTIGRSELREAVAATSGVSGLSGTITCQDTGDCVPEATFAIYRIPAVPVQGGTADPEPVYSDTVSLDDLEP